MAQKYIMALDYVDLHAKSVLQKQAKKRPLGDIETRHRYTPTQPVLSCRTVDIDVSGTRTYRPKSSADIITEQHALIHKIYSKARNIASAPPRRPKTPRTSRSNTVINDQNTNKENNLKSVEVQGRPLTSLSQRPTSKSNSRGSTSSGKRRPKTTGGLKSKQNTHENFMLVRANRDLIETRRSYRSITDKIHEQWTPENHDLNTGTFQRGKKTPGVPTVDSWLTFSGSQGDEAKGLVDAFADLEKQGEYYNIEGGVGNRIAQQLQAGDKIRIGINGSVQTQDLKVKKWIKEDSYIKPETAELVTDMPKKEGMAKNEPAFIPLCWDDQVDGEKAKVLTPRGPPPERTTINLNETRPVVFNKLIPDDHPSQANSLMNSRREGYRVKQRKKSKASVDGGKERDNHKVTVVTIDSKSEEEEKQIASLTVEEVVSKSCKGKRVEKTNSRQDDIEKHSVSFHIEETEGDPPNSLGSQSRVSIYDTTSGTSVEQRHPIIKPTQPTFNTKSKEVDLDIVGTLNVQNGTRPLSNESNGYDMGMKSPLPSRGQIRIGSARSSRGSMKSGVKTLGSGSSSSLGLKQNEAEYIQISHPVMAQNSSQKRQEYSSQSIRVNSGIREPAPSPELEDFDELDDQPTPMTPMVQIKPAIKQVTPSLSINIPTADYTDSALNSPSHKQHTDLESSPQMKRAQDMRDEQIDQITDLLVDAIIGPNDKEAA